MDRLLNLIQSLSPKEKSQYVKYARQHLKEKDSKKVVLFQLICQQLRGQVKDYQKQASVLFRASSLPSIKTQLYNQILESLTRSSMVSVRSELSQMIDEVRMLTERGLFRQAISRIEKAKKIATANALHFQFLEISLLHRRIIRQYKTKDVAESLQREQRNCAEKIGLIAEEFDLLNLYETFFIKRRMGTLKTDAVASLNQSGREAGSLRSFEARAYYYLLEHMSGNNERNYQRAFTASENLIALFEENQAILHENLSRYLRSIANYLNACIMMGYVESARNKLEEIKKLKPKNSFDEALKQSTVIGQEIILYFHLKEYGKIIFMAPQVKRMLDKYGVFIHFDRSLEISYNMAISFFLKNKMGKSLDWLNTCLEARDNSELKEKVTGKAFGVFVQASAMVFRIIVFYEMGNLKLAGHFIGPTTYFLENRGLKESTLWKILMSLKLVVSARKDKAEELVSLQNQLNGNARYEEYTLWVERALGNLKDTGISDSTSVKLA
ncbi:MAG: hypothetical protein AAFZ15_13645 [Bacteroidota bacterium]